MKSPAPAAWMLIVSVLAGCAPPPADDIGAGHFTRIGDDLIGSGDQVYSADSVVGDVMLSGGELGFSGAVGGSYLGAAGDQDVGGRIAGTVRAVGGAVVLSADVGRNITLAGGNIRIDTAASITRNAYLAGGTVVVNGPVGQALLVTGGDVTLDGTIGGNVDVAAQRLQIGPHARIDGTLRHRVPGGGVTIHPTARIIGGVTALPAADWRNVGRMLRSIWLLGFLVAGAVVVMLFPRLATASALSTREHAGASAAFGVAWIVGLPMLIVLASITVVGLPLAGLTTAAYLILLYLGRAAIAVWLGERLVGTWRRGAHVAPVVSFLVGGVLLVLIGLVPVIGAIVGVITMIVGTGAVLVAVWPRKTSIQPV